LVLHQFFDLSELASTLVTLVPFKHIDYYLSHFSPLLLLLLFRRSQHFRQSFPSICQAGLGW
jgi:hypothetical protein